MSWISRLKDPKYYIDFDSGYIFDEAGNIVAEITSSTQINILLYLADHPEKWLKKEGQLSLAQTFLKPFKKTVTNYGKN